MRSLEEEFSDCCTAQETLAPVVGAIPVRQQCCLQDFSLESREFPGLHKSADALNRVTVSCSIVKKTVKQN
jgi:hypothetical protein